MNHFIKHLQIYLLGFILLIPSFSFADNVVPPPQAVQVSPEEFKELKKEEVKDSSGSLPVGSFNFSGGGGGREAAILIFAIVGTVVLISWVPYTAMLAYERFKKPENFKDYSLLNFQYNSFINFDGNNRNGDMSSLKYTFLTQRLNQNKNSSGFKSKKLGLNFEIGHYSFKYSDRAKNISIPYNSNYWLIGPSIIFGAIKEKVNSTFLKFDLQAGTSFERDVNLILKFDISLNYKFRNEIFLGAGVGDTFLNGQKGQGIVSHLNDLSVHWLASVGMIF